MAVSAPRQLFSLPDNIGKTAYEPAPPVSRREILSSGKVPLHGGVSLVSDSRGSNVRDFCPNGLDRSSRKGTRDRSP